MVDAGAPLDLGRAVCKLASLGSVALLEQRALRRRSARKDGAPLRVESTGGGEARHPRGPDARGVASDVIDATDKLCEIVVAEGATARRLQELDGGTEVALKALLPLRLRDVLRQVVAMQIDRVGEDVRRQRLPFGRHSRAAVVMLTDVGVVIIDHLVAHPEAATAINLHPLGLAIDAPRPLVLEDVHPARLVQQPLPHLLSPDDDKRRLAALQPAVEGYRALGHADNL